MMPLLFSLDGDEGPEHHAFGLPTCGSIERRGV